MTAKRKVYIYARVSGRAQVEGDGLPRQLDACKALVEREGFTVAEVFQELGVSGTTELENRPALSTLYAALDTGEVSTIVIERLDRLARDLMVQETILGDFRKRGIEVISTMEPDLCSNDPSRVLVRQIFGAIAEYDRAMIVIKLRGARERMKARSGRCEGQKPFGHYPGERPTLDELLRLRASGLICEHVADALNASQQKTRSGKPWSGPVVAKILRRENADVTLRSDCAA